MISSNASLISYSRQRRDKPMAMYGYARVSTEDQTLGLQQTELQAKGCTKIFAEKISGARSDRPQLAKLLKALKPSDVVVVTKLDRLARSTHDLQSILRAIQNARADFKVLDTPSLDTTNAYGKLLFDILGALAEFERSLIKTRTSEGRKAAKARGVHLGRPSKLNHNQKQEALERMKAGESLVDIARTYNVDPTTIGRL
jgi:DNA invertase Pin-like site-specific DNA recombinase